MHALPVGSSSVGFCFSLRTLTPGKVQEEEVDLIFPITRTKVENGSLCTFLSAYFYTCTIHFLALFPCAFTFRVHLGI